MNSDVVLVIKHSITGLIVREYSDDRESSKVFHITNLQVLPVRNEVVVVELLASFVAFLLLDHLQVVEDLLHLEALVEADLEVRRDIFEVFVGRLKVFRVVLARWLKVPKNRS